jgi:hypothetical protein
MRTSGGYDRLSTQEELHQVLDMLGDLDRTGWVILGEGCDRFGDDVWADSLDSDATDADSLAATIEEKSQLKN